MKPHPQDVVRDGLIVGRFPDGGEFLIGYADPEPTSPSDLYAPPPERERELRSMPYHEYLRTEEWKERRRVAISAAEHRCEECGRGHAGLRLEVHHLTYENRGCEWGDEIRVLCHECHATTHGFAP